MRHKEDSASRSSKPHPKDTGEIRPLRYGRGLAALLVCLFHYEGAPKYIGENAIIASTNPYLFTAGHSRVDFFLYFKRAYYLPCGPERFILGPQIHDSWALPQWGRVRFNTANRGGSSCRLRYRYARILMRRSCGVWPGEAKMAP